MHDNSEVEDLSFAALHADGSCGGSHKLRGSPRRGAGIVLQCEKAKLAAPWSLWRRSRRPMVSGAGA